MPDNPFENTRSALPPESDSQADAQRRLSAQYLRGQEQKNVVESASNTGQANFEAMLGGKSPTLLPKELQQPSSAPAVNGKELQPGASRDAGPISQGKDVYASAPTPTSRNPDLTGLQQVASVGSPAQPSREAGFTQPATRDGNVNRPGDSVTAKASDSQTGTTTRTIGPISITTAPDGKTTVSKDAPGSTRQPTGADQPIVAAVPQGGLQKPSGATEMQPRQVASTTDVPGAGSQPRPGEKNDATTNNPVRGTNPIPPEAGTVSRPAPVVPEIPSSVKAAGLTLDSKIVPPTPNDVGIRESATLNKSAAVANTFDSSTRQMPPNVDRPSVDRSTFDKTSPVNDGRNADSSAIKVSNPQAPSDGQSKPQFNNPSVESQLKATNLTTNASVFESQVKQNPGFSTDAPGKQTSVAAVDVQGKSTTVSGSESFGTRRETGIQMPETKQSTGRAETGLQLPDTKQSSGRTESGVAQTPDARNTGRNDSNSTKLPDAKTLANLDQKFGDKLNPPNKDTGLPIPMPSGGLPDILGGLRGDRDNRSVKDAKADSIPSREGTSRGDLQGSKDNKDAKSDGPSGKETRVIDGKTDVRAGTDDRSTANQKGSRSDSDSGSKSVDGKGSTDVRVSAQDTKPGADGRSADVKQQGGSNLIHDAGTKSDGSSGSRSDIGGKSGDRSNGLPEKIFGDKGNSNNSTPDKGGNAITDKVSNAIANKGGNAIADKGGPDKVTGDRGPSEKTFGEGKTRVDASTPRVVDPDGKSPGAKSDTPNRTGIGEKVPSDSVSAAGTKGGPRADGQLVLPPGSLPVPDLVSGVRNIAQQIDSRGGRSQIDDKVVRPQDPGKTDAVRTSAAGASGDGAKGVLTGGVGDGAKTVATGGTREGVKTSGIGGTGDGVKTVVTGGTGEGIKTALTGASGEGVRTVVTGGIGDGSKTPGASGIGDATKGGAKPGDAGALVVPQPVVPLAEMVGNLKAIASRIFPPEAKTGRPDVAFENSLPGRKTERLEDRTQSTVAGVRSDSAIPIVRAISERIGKADEQFVIKTPQQHVESTGIRHSKANSSQALPPWIAPPEEIGSGRDEAAEKLLSNLELVGSIESSAALEVEEEEIFPLAAVEYFGGDFERSISSEDEVAFDGDGKVADDDEQSTRYQYIVEAGDTVELIAIKVFTNVTLAPLIYEINKESIPIGMQDGRMVFTLKVGTIIWLPFPKEIKSYLRGLGASY